MLNTEKLEEQIKLVKNTIVDPDSFSMVPSEDIAQLKQACGITFTKVFCDTMYKMYFAATELIPWSQINVSPDFHRNTRKDHVYRHKQKRTNESFR